MSTLVVCLGNPGSEYGLTRHNIAWQAIDASSISSSLNWKSKFKGVYAQKGDYIFLKPETYMNLSGESVQPCKSFFKVEIENILVVHDELDLPFGTVMFKKGGGLAGHNGLKSIAEKLGTKDFLRLRMGISRPKFGDVSRYVLSKFNDDEDLVIDEYYKLFDDALNCFMEAGYDEAAKRFAKAKIEI